MKPICKTYKVHRRGRGYGVQIPSEYIWTYDVQPGRLVRFYEDEGRLVMIPDQPPKEESNGCEDQKPIH